MGVIYLRTNKVNGKKYVGQSITKNFKKRQSKWNNLSQPYAGKAINRARAKYGIDSFSFEILKECEDNELDKWEIYYIKELNTKVPYGYNMTDGGDTTRGYTHSEETKRKLSESHKGRKLSEETKIKIGKATKGRKHTEESKKKMSAAQKGKKLSEENKIKISEKLTNGKLSKPVFQINKNTNEVIAEFPSLMEVERQLGYCYSHISKCCLGKRKSCGGFKWRYA